MSAQQLLMEAWEGLKSELDLPPAIACKVTATTSDLADAGEVLKALNQFAAKDGWVCYQSRVHVVRNGSAISGNPGEDGLPLSGELVNGSRSLVLRTVPGGWRLTAIEESEGDTAIAFDTRRAGTGVGGVNSLAYRVYWLHDDKRGYEPRLARFTGYQEK